MKKTNERGKLINLFRSKKFVEDLYKEDKNNLIGKYHEEGYRDAEIISDSVYKHDEKTVNIDIVLEEGPLYHIRSINWWETPIIPLLNWNNCSICLPEMSITRRNYRKG